VASKHIIAALLWIAAGSGCGGSGSKSTADAQPSTSETQPWTADGAACAVEVSGQANGGHLHTAKDCDPVTSATNPPSSGTHYPNWAAYKSYAAPVPWGFLVHCLEHGAIVVVYNCPDGCADELAQAQALMAGLPPDAACGGSPMKIVLAPDPGLDTRWAASAWTWTLRAPCFDSQAFAAFIADHYDGPDTEAECGNGVDRSATDWCP
jgi:hypothetical protein